ncbi:flagellar protein FlaG [Pseudomonas sp.]|uniref:flagellar protein FlaG n=1 Tax=Pseudomonas sp. TaxID=306 RepID=UPI0028ACB624|nr:flagellar protein FlaG [Pseudomonas sp.]
MDMSVKMNPGYTPPVLPAIAPLKGSADLAASPDTPAAVTAVTSPAPAASREALEKAVGDMRDFARDNQRNLEFSIDDDSGKVVVKVIATDSGEVIRQLPSEAALKLAQTLNDANSLLFKDEA